MAENAARIRWAGAGVSLPRRFHTSRGVRLAVRRLLGDRRYADVAGGLGEWSERHDGAAAAANALEELASPPDVYPHGVHYEPWQQRPAATPPPRTSY